MLTKNVEIKILTNRSYPAYVLYVKFPYGGKFVMDKPHRGGSLDSEAHL